ncbi:flagellar basal body P-ring protein FlgI [Maridesulfovibrio ferrireducens]|uniref:flagellar basal body P-ring protein FlgI n=1 Tax=Maridesulfovibrio ferrireducens TaxID=246191 RepID=UPI001A1F9677|nr:flagellar basal body P-ring protein FlgI [Maridesulfovibrio ferrireducens]MBI9112199.1 flagellar basal body P-ring protein FlgI [Maridesulfovibrio ferrireducens]
MKRGNRMNNISAGFTATILLLFVIFMHAQPVEAVRLKDISSFSGVRDNALVGYGLVVGLSGTGDGTNSAFTITSMMNMLEKMGVQVDRSSIKPKNVAAVMVTAKMPVSAKPGAPLDVTISSIGDSKSLFGGVLLLTPLKGIDGNVYALAQGALTVGGFSATGEAATASKNVVTVARIPNGATIERSVSFAFNKQRKITINLGMSDFGTIMQVVKRINTAIGGKYATAVDASTVDLAIPDNFRGNMVPLMASLENLEISPDVKAKVVVDEKTGTVVLGRNVRLTKVAIAHGNLQVIIAEGADVSQPGPFAPEGAQTVTTPETDLQVEEDNNRLMLVEGATLQELVDGLNAIGATPRDLISILRTMKVAGALHAELEVI